MLLVATVPLRPREHPAHLVGVPGPPTARSGDAAPYEGVRDLSGRASAGGPDGLENWQQLKGSPISSMRYLKGNLRPSLRRYLSSATLCHSRFVPYKPMYCCVGSLSSLDRAEGPQSAPGGSGRR
jgi:hypothetical protein